MAKAISFGTINAARETAQDAANISGSPVPILEFLTRYGRYVPEAQLNFMGQIYLGVGQQDYEPRLHYLERLILSGVQTNTGTGTRSITTIVGRRDQFGTPTEFRLIKTTLTPGQGYDDLQAAINAALTSWQRGSNVQGFTVLEPVWRID